MQENLFNNNIIITDSSSNLRALGRNALANKWQNAVIAIIVYILCLQVPPAILNGLFGINLMDYYSIDRASFQNVDPDLYITLYNLMPRYSYLSGIYLILVTGAMNLGLTLFFLAMFRRQNVGTGDVFLGFERFGKALGLYLFQSLFILLWTFLFIIPGFIAAIRYSQAFFILADDPTKGIRQCMDESKAMMRGNKAKYFCMVLSFIGWAILAAIPAGILGSIGDTLYMPNYVTVIFDIIGLMCMAPVLAYMYSTQAGFYEILAGHLIKDTQPAPINPEAIPAAVRQMQAAAAPAEPKPQAPQAAAPAEPKTQAAPQAQQAQQSAAPQTQEAPQSSQAPQQQAVQTQAEPAAPANEAAQTQEQPENTAEPADDNAEDKQ